MPEKRKKIEQPIVEQKETEPVEVNLAGIFKERLNQFDDLPEKVREDEATMMGLDDLGIESVKKTIPSLLLQENNNLGLWIDCKVGKTSEDPHTKLVNSINEYGIKSCSLPQIAVSGQSWIIVDEKDELFLIVKKHIAQQIIQKIDMYDLIEWQSFIEKYNLKKIIGEDYYVDPVDGETLIGTDSKFQLVDSDIIGKIREMEFLNNFRRKKHPEMTNTQFLRFLTAIKTKKPNQTYEDVAEKIITMDKTEDPTRRPDEESLAE